MIGVALICVVLLHFTAYGRGIYAIGNNPRAAYHLGCADDAHSDRHLCAVQLLRGDYGATDPGTHRL